MLVVILFAVADWWLDDRGREKGRGRETYPKPRIARTGGGGYFLQEIYFQKATTVREVEAPFPVVRHIR